MPQSPTARRWTIAGIAALGALVLIAVVAAAFDWGLLRGTVESRASASLGRRVTIARLVRLDAFSLTPHLRAEGIIIAQPDWAAKGGSMVTLRTAEFRLPLLGLLHGAARPRDMTLTGLRVNLIHLADGRANWKFGPPKPGKPLGTALTIRDAQIHVDDARRHIVLDASVTADARGLAVTGKGTQRGAPLALTLTGAPLDARTGAYPFAATIASPLSTLKVHGDMDGAFNASHFTAEGSASGQNLQYLDDIILAGLPGTQGFRVAGRLRHEDSDWLIRTMNGTIGTSTFAGPLTVRKRDGRTIIDGDIHSTRLDFNDLASDEGRARGLARRAKVGPRVVPYFKIDLTHLRKTDGRLGFTVDSLVPADGVARSARGTIRADHAVLTLAPLRVGLPHGAVTGSVKVDHRKGLPLFSVDLAITGARLADFAGAKAGLDAPLSGKVKLSGRGVAIRDAVAVSDGRIALASGAGRIKTSAAEFLGQDAGRGVLAGADAQVDLRCAVFGFAGKHGLYTADPVTIDTAVSRADVTGAINFDGEALVLHVAGKAKQQRLLRLPAPVELTGTLSAPKIGLADNAVKGGLLGKIGRVLGVGKTFDPATDADCAALTKRALR